MSHFLSCLSSPSFDHVFENNSQKEKQSLQDQGLGYATLCQMATSTEFLSRGIGMAVFHITPNELIHLTLFSVPRLVVVLDDDDTGVAHLECSRLDSIRFCFLFCPCGLFPVPSLRSTSRS